MRISIVTLCLLASIPLQASDIKANQGFLDIEARTRLTDQWSSFLNHQSKIQDQSPDYFLWHMKAGLRYQPVSWLQLAAAHRYQEDRTQDNWERESRSEFDITPSMSLNGWKLSSRNRFEYREFDCPKSDRWRYRNEFKAAHALGKSPWTGYLAEEPHFDFETNQWSKHRITTGVSRKFRSNLTLNFYYRWDVIERSKQSGQWDITQIFGIKCILNIN